MKIEVSEERVIYQGKPYEETKKWGEIQFPHLYKMDDGRLAVKIHGAEDCWEEHTDSTRFWRVSSDGGNTWESSDSLDNSIGTKIFEGQTVYFPEPEPFVTDSANVTPILPFSYLLPSDKIEKSKDGKLPFPSGRFCDMAGQVHYVFNMDYMPDDWKRGWVAKRHLKNGELLNEFVPVEQPVMSVNGVFHPRSDGGSNFVALRPQPISGRIKTDREGNVWVSCYCFEHLNPYTGSLDHRSASLLYKSTDNAKTFKLQSYVPFLPDTTKRPTSYLGNGFNECDIEFPDDGSIIMLMRTADVFCGGPEWNDMYYARSTDGGKTFSEPVSMGNGILPSLVKLNCGVILAAYGRPGIFVRAVDGATGTKWEEPIEIMTPNDRSGLMNVPPKRPDFHEWCGSCCNVDLKPISDNQAMLVYSDFYYPDVSGKTDKKLKSILCKIITVTE